jgi:DNA-binding beta-propeller fold protein YncE
VAVDPTGKFAYVTNSVSSNVSAYTINATTGALTPVAGSPFAASPFVAGTNPYGVAVDPTGKFAIVANNGSDSVAAYTINATTGALTTVAGSPVAAGSYPTSVAVGR